MKTIKQETKQNMSEANKRRIITEDLKQKLNMFDRIPDQCLTCNSPFDRKNREQVQSWFVVVKNAENSVKIYCPECWHKAIKLVEEFYGENK